ncbi:MAG: FAD binding domain-containing protein [Bacillota bacterium]|nr:FAD binding domain-containing protein [Bacillota bacterium]
MKINNYYIPDSIEEAYKIIEKDNATIIGGGAFLHLGKRNINSAVDIGKLGLDYITENEENIEIGAAVTLREIEISNLLNKYFDNILSKTVFCIMGVQIRNMATIGGTIWGKYGFSDLLTSLLVLNTQVVLYKRGKISLEEYLNENIEKDILLRIEIKKGNINAKYLNLKNTSTDFSILNAAAANIDGKCRIAIGARPAAARLCYKAMEYIDKEGINEVSVKKAGEIASEELDFGSDIRASEEYRKDISSVLVKRALLEVKK